MEKLNAHNSLTPDVDGLLLMLQDWHRSSTPSPEVRQKLATLAASTLHATDDGAQRNHLWSFPWPRMALACCVLIGVVTVSLLWVSNADRANSSRIEKFSTVSSSVVPNKGAGAVHVVGASHAASGHRTHLALARKGIAGPGSNFTVRLPYSNDAVANGTSTTIRVAISRDELASLGFPVDESLNERKFIANITIGDDGLPRSISVPFPMRGLN